MELTPVQVRILGCLVEKERATPDNYPLTMNGLLAACNQTTNRYPVVSYNEATVSNALENLRAAQLTRIDYSRSNRAEKYRHVLDQALQLDGPELAVLAVLMLRGPQTVAELKARSDRLHAFDSQEEVEAVLARLARHPEALVQRLERGAGQKEARWVHLLGGPVSPDALPLPAEPGRTSSRGDRLAAVEAELEALRDEVARLRADQEALADRLRGLLD
jgi:uncharacterized protein YceH (UPF0502 family)